MPATPASLRDRLLAVLANPGAGHTADRATLVAVQDHLAVLEWPDEGKGLVVLDHAGTSPEDFRGLFLSLAKKLGFPDRPEAVEYLIRKHYAPKNRPFRYCHPRDLLMQIRNYCSYKDCPLDISDEYIDLAVENYFAVM